MLEVAPAIFEGTDFAMKGGTAINFFAENMPRLPGIPISLPTSG
jgi:hypothetical protein